MESSALPAFVAPHPLGATIAVHLQPRSSSNEIGMARGAELRIRVTAPPVDSAANDALVRLIADTLGCPRRNVDLLRGDGSRHKVVLISGLTPAEVAQRLEAPGG